MPLVLLIKETVWTVLYMGAVSGRVVLHAYAVRYKTALNVGSQTLVHRFCVVTLKLLSDGVRLKSELGKMGLLWSDGWWMGCCSVVVFCVSAVCLGMGCEQAVLEASDGSVCCSHGKMWQAHLIHCDCVCGPCLSPSFFVTSHLWQWGYHPQPGGEKHV